MSAQRDLWLLLPGPVRRLPADLAAVLVLVGLTVGSVFLPVVSETPLRVVFGLVFVLFVPGYVFIAALFPGADEESVTEGARDGGSAGSGIGGLERLAFSFGLSIAIVPLLGLILNVSPWRIQLGPVLVSLSGFTVIATVIAATRRWNLPEEERFSVPYRVWLAAGRRGLFEPSDRADAALNVVLVLSIVLAVSSVGYAVAVPKQGQEFSELYILTENETGALVADDYPRNLTADEPEPLTVGVGNYEQTTLNYTVVVTLQDVAVENNDTQVLEEQRIDTYRLSLSHNETWQQDHSVTPRLTGDRVRLTYLLYRGDAPSDPSIETAYREVHLWVDVSNN
jgi:uncharacterized membrane protein